MLFFALLAESALVGPKDCALPPEAREEMLALPYAEFDQTPGAGWRKLDEAGCPAAAGEIIEDYLLHSRRPLADVKNVRVLRFHAGQMFAMAGAERAIDYFRGAYKAADDATTAFDWNSYVDATVAFLEKDKPALIEARARLAKQTPFDNGMVPNLAVVDGLIACFDRDYEDAYAEECRNLGAEP